MIRYGAIGALFGIFVGFLVNFLFPNLMLQEIFFRMSSNQALGDPPGYYSAQSGSVIATGNLFPILFGLLGFLAGVIIIKSKKSSK
ncbi:hypothetical protein HYW55_04045 [Candidatus Gottesmanbacteria bacterium]|nr:hypothetical protein [Candidatus Gottesmanbacteria bacterium]